MTFSEQPVSLPHLRMVKKLADQLKGFEESNRLPVEYHETWARCFQEIQITEAEADVIGKWYVQHHSICPSIPYVNIALKFLREHRTLPNQRIACKTELLAGEILGFLSERRIELHEATRALAQASALTQLAYYRNESPYTDRDDVKGELEGIARLADFFADDILNEVQQGTGSLAYLEKYLIQD
ncbi:hypothetical protein ACKU3Z_029630 [Pseudomonas aeruginosa]|nr:hypothetical protein [Pseudomonas aeruginosa]